MSENVPLYQPFKDLLSLQHQLTAKQSKYFGNLFQKLLGTDTIPFLLMTTEGEILHLSSASLNSETMYFRLEAVEEHQIFVSLLQAFDFEGEKLKNVKDLARLERTTATAFIPLQQVSAIQVVSPFLLSTKYFIESKW